MNWSTEMASRRTRGARGNDENGPEYPLVRDDVQCYDHWN